ncbi:MAG TPA: hypothetical protein VF748_12155 [Candidatus Acidoferrum sp.]
MNWVKLTRPDRITVWVNLDRFDTVIAGENEDGVVTTELRATLSDTEEDHYLVEVLEAPEEFLK